MERILVIIPAYQAQSSIGPLVRAIRDQGLPVLVVDDASPDQTSQEAGKAGAAVIRLPVNQGKGAALREGFSKGLAGPYEGFLTMDSDGQHLPEEIPNFLEAAQRSNADLVLGNRMSHPEGMPWVRRLTNRWMSWILSWLIHQRIPDSQCGFRLVHRRLLEAITLSTRRFEIESELLVKAAQAHGKIVSIAVCSFYPDRRSFIRPFRDTVRFFRFLWGLVRAPVSKGS